MAARAHPATMARFTLATGRRLKVVVPHIDMNVIAGRSVFAPQLARSEEHRINVLSLFAKTVRHGIREMVNPMISHNRTGLAPNVTRQPRVAGRMDIKSTHPLAYRKTRFNVGIVARR